MRMAAAPARVDECRPGHGPVTAGGDDERSGSSECRAFAVPPQVTGEVSAQAALSGALDECPAPVASAQPVAVDAGGDRLDREVGKALQHLHVRRGAGRLTVVVEVDDEVVHQVVGSRHAVVEDDASIDETAYGLETSRRLIHA